MMPTWMLRSAILAPLFATVALVGISSSSRAELSPQAYRNFQKDSPEALTIKVKSVKIVEKKGDHVALSEVTAQAEVTSVTRSASGLHAGDTIRITYTLSTYAQPILGGSQPDLLREGGTYPAFLEKVEGGAYAPAAEGYSFRLLK